jgi:alpha-beta hydrolase superfamily lysophospholipase
LNNILAILAQEINMQYTVVKGLSIAYSRTGNGPALVLLQGGLNCNTRVWKQQITNLSANFTVVARDAPGAGKSDDTPEHFTIDDWADCLAGLLDNIGIRKAHSWPFLGRIFRSDILRMTF